MRPALLLTLALCAATASAEEPIDTNVRAYDGLLSRAEHHRPQMLSFYVGIPYYYYGYNGFPIGLSARYYLPIVHDGFIPQLNDEFGIEFGADFAFFTYPGGSFFGLALPIEVLWDFHLIPRFDAYVKLGVAIDFGFGDYRGYAYPYGAYPVSAVGLRFKVTNAFYLRAELGYPWSKVGIGFAF